MNKKNGLIKILENISYFKDICNVYIIKNKEKKILIDFGSGTILEQVLDLDDIQWILHTHCHRDQCQGDSIVNNKIRIAVPRRELSYIKNSDIFYPGFVCLPFCREFKAGGKSGVGFDFQ